MESGVVLREGGIIMGVSADLGVETASGHRYCGYEELGNGSNYLTVCATIGAGDVTRSRDLVMSASHALNKYVRGVAAMK